MRLRTIFLAGWIGLGGIAYGQDRGPTPTEPRKLQLEAAPMPTPASNQYVADAIASALSKNPTLQGYRIDVVYIGGVAELQGQVKNADQREVAKQTAMGIPGVEQVRDRLALASAQERLVQDTIPVLPPSSSIGQTFPPTPSQVGGAPSGGDPNGGAPYGGPPMQGPPMMQGGMMPQEPTPIFQAQPGAMPNPQYQPPPMPPYAWPAYAPYNNYSRVATPTLHKHGQFPFIGPMYPYPKVPLGWRRVTLEWQDGAWWYGRQSNSHDWWRVRYW